MKNLALLVVSVFVLVLAAELGLRFAGFEPRRHNDDSEFMENGWGRPEPELGWTNREGAVRSNEAGHAIMNFWSEGRRASWPEPKKDPDKIVYVFGGSYAQGYGVVDEETFVYRLNELYPKVWFENFSVGAYGTHQSLMRFKQLLDGASGRPVPDLVIYGFIGDHRQRNVASFRWIKYLIAPSGEYVIPPHATWEDGRLAEHPFQMIPLWPLETDSVLVTLLHEGGMAIRYYRSNQHRWDVTYKIIVRFSEIADAAGSHLLVMLLSDAPKEMREVLDAEGVDVADCVNPEYKSRADLYQVGGDGHPNGRQHEMWSACAKAAIDSRGLLK